MHRQAPAQEFRAKTVFRLVALALALVAAWPSAFSHPRRDYVCVGSASATAAGSASAFQSRAGYAGFTDFTHHLALAVAIETPVAANGAAPCPRDVAPLAPFGTLFGSPSSERGPPVVS